VWCHGAFCLHSLEGFLLTATYNSKQPHFASNSPIFCQNSPMMFQKGPILCQRNPIFSHGCERALHSLEWVLLIAVDFSKEPHLVTNEPDFVPKQPYVVSKETHLRPNQSHHAPKSPVLSQKRSACGRKSPKSPFSSKSRSPWNSVGGVIALRLVSQNNACCVPIETFTKEPCFKSEEAYIQPKESTKPYFKSK